MTETQGWTRKAGAALARLPDRIRLTLEGWREHARLSREMAGLRERGEFDRTMTDTGLSASDMPRLLHAHPHTPQQLAQMMRHAGVERAKLPHDPQTAASLRAIEWRCGDCATWRRCHDWLASGETPEEYRAFCPNAAAFDELRRSQAAALREQGVLGELAATHGEDLGH
jgi:hypothetical protein